MTRKRRLTMAGLFHSLDAPLKNARWSWGATRSDGAVILRQWTTDTEVHDDGHEYVRIARGTRAPSARQHGWRERLAHIELIRAGAPCFVVLCDGGTNSKVTSDTVVQCDYMGSV